MFESIKNSSQNVYVYNFFLPLIVFQLAHHSTPSSPGLTFPTCFMINHLF